MEKLNWEIDNDRRGLEDRINKCRDVLPLAEQIMGLNIGISELLALHSAVYEKAEMERIPLDTAAYKVVEDIRDYSVRRPEKRARQTATADLHV